ncbi:Rho GTPase activation protein [Gorgonomyces haynaldii]|nr:Rho GTPase activation protein [Gorgonomyces haynaldii]
MFASLSPGPIDSQEMPLDRETTIFTKKATSHSSGTLEERNSYQFTSPQQMRISQAAGSLRASQRLQEEQRREVPVEETQAMSLRHSTPQQPILNHKFERKPSDPAKVISSVERAPTAKANPVSKSTPNLLAASNARTLGISNPALNPEAAAAMNPFSKENMQQTQAQSLPLLNRTNALPQSLKEDISNFKIDGYAKKYFSKHKKGIFRRTVPLEKMLTFQKGALNAPLLLLNKNLKKDALKCFKLIQKIMSSKDEILKCYEEVNQLLEKGVRQGGLRDEIYVQLCKQLSENPYNDQVIRGWTLMSVLTVTFPPSKNLENYLKNFIEERFDLGGHESKLDTIIRYSLSSLIKTCKTGPRGRTMTIQELDQTLQAPFKTSVFGDTLENIMERQRKANPNMELPHILVVLAEAILKLNGAKSEGIFRVPGDAEAVSDLRCRIDKNDYVMEHLTDPNTPSSLLKLWLRELSEPLIPAEYYSACIAVGMDDGKQSTESLLSSAWSIIESLPTINNKVARYMIQFLQVIAEQENQPFTKMTPANLAMVFAPNFLRCPSDNPATIFENTKFEQQFLRILIVGNKR